MVTDRFSQPALYAPLHPREVEIIRLISQGLTDREVARKLSLSLETIKWYNKRAYAKLGVSNRTEAVAIASQFNLLAQIPAEPVLDKHHPNHNLPAPLNTFIGRTAEIPEILGLLQENRLVVLTGPGGTGKTRLALEVARAILDDYPHGVWWVELAPISDTSLVPDAIVQALEINLSTNQIAAEVLKRFLRNKHILLVLDNFEHLLDATPIVGELLTVAEHLTILATSRERLHLYGEQEYLVRPLRLPDARVAQSIEQILRYDACNLFYQRAKTVNTGFLIDQVQANAIAQLCIRLDGLPLAVELAASQTRIFSPVSLMERLNSSLASLPDGPRDLPARQRTLRATIEWSFNLLRADEKKLFARLSIFTGGATLDSIRLICSRGISNFMDTLVGLLDKNLVYVRDDPTGEPRFSMLETIREYATEQLENLGEVAGIRQAHAEYYANLAEQAKREIRGFKGKYWYTRLRLEQDNLRSVMAWSLAGEQVNYGLRVIASLRDYWFYTGTAIEGFRWIGSAMKLADIARPELVGGMLLCATHISYRIGDYERGIGWGQCALEIYRHLDDELNVAWCLGILSTLIQMYPDRRQEALAMCQEALRLFRLQGDQPGITQALNSMGEIYRLNGEIVEAKQCYEESLAVALQLGDQLRQSIVYANLSFITYQQKEYENAVRFILSSIRLMAEQDNPYGIATYIPLLAGPMTALGDERRAARLLGASRAMLENIGAGHDPADEPDVAQYEELTRSRLGEQAFEKAWQEGMAMSIQEVTAYALEEIDFPK
jgi:predicted ATPase/DNA-binding CsgD family transcriptional regulator